MGIFAIRSEGNNVPNHSPQSQSSSGISRVFYIVVGHNLKKGDVKEVSWTLKRVI